MCVGTRVAIVGSMINMKKDWSRPLVLIGAWAFLQCGGDTPNTATYSAAEQSAAAARVVGRFESADKSISLEICEGSPSSAAINACQDSFQMQSQGNGKRISDGTTSGLGCGGCPFNGVVLPVRYTVVEDGRTVTEEGVAEYGPDDGTSLNRDEVRIYADATSVGPFVLKNGIIKVLRQRPYDSRDEDAGDSGSEAAGSGAIELLRVGNARCP